MNNIKYSLFVAAFFVHSLSCSYSSQSNSIVEKLTLNDAVRQLRPDEVIPKFIRIGYLCKLQNQLGIHEQKSVANDSEKLLFLTQAADDYITNEGITCPSYVSRTLLYIDDKHCAMLMQHPISRYKPRVVVIEFSK